MLLRDWDFTKFFQDLNGRLEAPTRQEKEAIEAPARHRRADSDVAGKFRREHSDLFPRRSSLLFGARNNNVAGEPVLTDYKPQPAGPEWLRRREKTDSDMRRRQEDTPPTAAVGGLSRRRNSSHLSPSELQAQAAKVSQHEDTSPPSAVHAAFKCCVVNCPQQEDIYDFSSPCLHAHTRQPHVKLDLHGIVQKN